MVIRSNAKINLYLEVLGKDPVDGYHTIDSVFQEVDLCDIITIEPSETDSVVFTNAKVDGDTTVHKALRLFKTRFGVQKSFSIKVEKHIPMGAGLGGGSSNAAFTLMGLAKMCGVDKKDVESLGREIGSDVAFFFTGGMARVTGKGEVIEAMDKRLDDIIFLIVYPDIHISSGLAYSWIGEYGKKLEDSRLIKKYSSNIDFLEKIMYNKFQKYTFINEGRLSIIKRELDSKLRARLSLMSGSGSSLFFVYAEEEKAGEGLLSLEQDNNFKSFISHPVYRS